MQGSVPGKGFIDFLVSVHIYITTKISSFKNNNNNDDYDTPQWKYTCRSNSLKNIEILRIFKIRISLL